RISRNCSTSSSIGSLPDRRSKSRLPFTTQQEPREHCRLSGHLFRQIAGMMSERTNLTSCWMERVMHRCIAPIIGIACLLPLVSQANAWCAQEQKAVKSVPERPQEPKVVKTVPEHPPADKVELSQKKHESTFVERVDLWVKVIGALGVIFALLL